MKNMMNSELVTNEQGCVYHLNLMSEHLADTVILVGDPSRVKMISSHFDSIEVERSNRELLTHTGYVGGKKISVISTGMGTDNIDIVMNELDILANFDLRNKTLRDEKKSLNIIRVGTCGSLQADIRTGSVVMTHYVLGLDGLLHFYQCDEDVFERELSDKFMDYMSWDDNLPAVYAVRGSDSLENLVDGDWVRKGITLTAPGFYGPQGRNIRLRSIYPDIGEKVSGFVYDDYKIANFEMESSAIFGLGKAMGHNTLTLCLVIANRITGDFLADYHAQMDELISRLLAKLTAGI